MAALLVAVGCRDAVQPSAILLRPLNLRSDTLVTGTPGLPQHIEIRATDLAGTPLAGAEVTWSAVGTGAAVQDGASATDADGDLDATWVMGTRASETQYLQVQVSRGTATGEIELRASLVASQVATLSVSPESVAVRLGTSAPLQVMAADPFGNTVQQPAVTFSSLDTGVATVSAAGAVQGLAVGSARVIATSQAATDTVKVHVIQVPAGIAVSADTVRFAALGQLRTLSAYLVDDQGYPVADTSPTATLADTSVTLVAGPGSLVLQSRANGSTTLSLTAGSLHRSVHVVVNQLPASIAVALASTKPIMLLRQGAPVPVSCQALDSNGVALSTPPVVETSSTGATGGTSCGSLHVVHSGADTLRIASGPVAVTVPIVVAVPPVVSPSVVDSLQLDSIPSVPVPWADVQPFDPSNNVPWVVSARRNSRGQVELYAALEVDTVFSYPFEDLYRYVSDDAVHFRFDGLVLAHTNDPCTPLGGGAENVAVVPRSDGPGWRMFFSGGAWTCYGWQVYSAVSTDERNWTVEAGVRVDNGGSNPGEIGATFPWPVGEGIVVDQRPDGQWRMIVGGYDRAAGQDKFQIVEWLSRDQVNWTYVGPVLTTEQMPQQASSDIFSPTIRQVAPGLWRMVFCGDNRSDLTGRIRLWSAVSTDYEHWQVEGMLMANDPGNLYYATMVGNTLITVRDDANTAPFGDRHGRRIGTATVLMP
jgi:hypothetical protein